MKQFLLNSAKNNTNVNVESADYVSLSTKQRSIPFEKAEVTINHYELYLKERNECKKYKLYLTSNGTARVQAGRLKSADISKYFQKIFVSEELGADKPDKRYFDRCAMQIPDFDPAKAMIVGDSLSSDIQGGINAGLDTCWYNPHGGTPKYNSEFVINSLEELKNIL